MEYSYICFSNDVSRKYLTIKTIRVYFLQLFSEMKWTCTWRRRSADKLSFTPKQQQIFSLQSFIQRLREGHGADITDSLTAKQSKTLTLLFDSWWRRSEPELIITLILTKTHKLAPQNNEEVLSLASPHITLGRDNN